MNWIFKAICAMTLLLAIQTGAAAQAYVSTPVEISKEKVRIGGKICYSHIVLERQTLYSISKAYGVSIEDIYRFNPSIKEEGLKKNSIIMIPSAEALKISQKQEEQKPEKQEKKQETVKVETKKVETKKVETKKVETKKVEKPVERIHIAKWYEDLDVIADQYGVSAEDIMAANNLTGRKLNKRQKLVIPYPGEKSAVVEKIKEVAEAVKEVFVPSADSTAVQETAAEETSNAKSKVTLSLMMPLTDKDGEANRNNMDFYCGTLLAVYDMAEKGIDCNLNIYDIMSSETSFSIESLNESDAIIGPVSSADLTRLFNRKPNAKAVISPLDPRAEKLVTMHPEMMQIPTPHRIQYTDLVNWLREDFKEGDHAVVITEKGARQAAVTTQIKEALDSSSLAYNTFSYSILEGRDVTEALTALMTREGANRIIIASESEAFVNDVVRNLNLLIYDNLDIVMYAPSKIRSFETIEVENFHNAAMHVSLAYYIDYETPEVKDFLLKYRALYNTEPTQFAFQGYDIAKYIATLCSKYGEGWKEMAETISEDMLQSTFRLRRQATGGLVNTGVRRIVYDKGYSVVRDNE